VETASVAKVWGELDLRNAKDAADRSPHEVAVYRKRNGSRSADVQALNRPIHSPYAVSARAVDARIVATITEL
jgi:hypothetical protein